MISERKKKKGLRLASNETMRLIRLVNENLDYEKIRSNQVTCINKIFNSLNCWKSLKTNLMILAAERNNEIIVDVEPDVYVVCRL